MGSNYKMSYNVDLAFVIDATGSMDHILEIVKTNALNFYRDLSTQMAEKGKPINQLRVRIVEFRDYLADEKNAMLTSDFFTLPQESEIFEKTVNKILPFGGGDDPEDGLEALAYAIKSPWCTSGTKKRHVIVVWSDEGTHEMGYGSKSPYYPKGMARNFAELTDWWNNSDYINQSAKRLLLFTPDLPGWTQISDNWDNVLHLPTDPKNIGKGLPEVQYAQILATITNSV